MRRSAVTHRSGCPFSMALELIGDPWSLLVVRDLMFRGFDTFDAFMNSGEGIASNILSDRLARLEQTGILTKRRDPEDGRRSVYRLTARGMDLAPIMIEMALWSAAHLRPDAPPEMMHAMKHDRQRVLSEARARWKKSGARR